MEKTFGVIDDRSTGLSDDWDEFDLDIRIEPAPPGITACAGDPPNSQPGSTCQFSCFETCGGNCPEPGVGPQVISNQCHFG